METTPHNYQRSVKSVNNITRQPSIRLSSNWIFPKQLASSFVQSNSEIKPAADSKSRNFFNWFLKQYEQFGENLRLGNPYENHEKRIHLQRRPVFFDFLYSGFIVPFFSKLRLDVRFQPMVRGILICYKR